MVYRKYSGKNVDVLKCPICGNGTVRQKGSGYKIHTDFDFVRPRRYRWLCDECGAVFYSTERRPSGENPCCEEMLNQYRGRQNLKYWTSTENDGVYKRELSASCGVCGEVYVWDETIILRGG